jgi:predicted transcriptional regulator
VPAPGRGDLSDRIRPKKSGRKSKKSVPTLPHSSEKRVRVSLRLDADRHLRVKLVATHLNQTLQSVFTQAIDEYIERHNPDVLDAIPFLRVRERGKKEGNGNVRKARGNRAKGQR